MLFLTVIRLSILVIVFFLFFSFFSLAECAHETQSSGLPELMAPRVPRRDGRLREEAIIANRAAAFQSAVPPTNGHTHTRTNSVNLTEVHGLLESPKNLFEYRTTTAFQFPDTPTFDITKSKRKKPIHVPFWASVPDSLEKDVKERIQALVVDGILIAISIPFFVLAGIILQIHGKQVIGHEFRVLEQCIKCVSLAKHSCRLLSS